MTRSRAWRTGLAGLAVLVATAACSDDPSADASSPARASCVVERRPLALADGTELYIEPSNLTAVGGDFLVSGAPTYRFNVGAGRSSNRLSADAYIGAYLGSPARTIAKPIRGRLGTVRTTALDERRWATVFSEVHPDSLPDTEHLTALWYAEYDGESLSLLEPMPVVGVDLAVLASSSLVRAGQRLAWVVYDYVPGQVRLHVYQRMNGEWSTSELPESYPEVAALGYGETSGLWLAVVGEDADLPEWQMSLRLYREASPWELVSRVTVAEPGTRILEPKVTVLSDGVTVSWLVLAPDRLSAHARVGIRSDARGTAYVVDPSAELVLPLAMPDGTLAWIVDHAVPVVGRREVRLLRVSDGRVVRAASASNPFTAFFAAAPVGRNEVLVVGPQMGLVPTESPVRSLILRLSTSC